MCNFKLNSKIKENSASIWFQHLTLISYYSSKNKKDNYISLDERNTVKSDQLLFREQKLHRLNENMISLHITLGKSGWNHLVGLVWTLGWHTLYLNRLMIHSSKKSECGPKLSTLDDPNNRVIATSLFHTVLYEQS